MDITSIKNNIQTQDYFDWNNKRYFYNKITSYDTKLTFNIFNGFYYDNEKFPNKNVYTFECYFNVYFGNETLKLGNSKRLHKSNVQNKISEKRFLFWKFHTKEYDNEYLKLLFNADLTSLRIKYFNEQDKNENLPEFHRWFAEKVDCYNVISNTESLYNDFKYHLKENRIE
jgi:hypothetical protein